MAANASSLNEDATHADKTAVDLTRHVGGRMVSTLLTALSGAMHKSVWSLTAVLSGL